MPCSKLIFLIQESAFNPIYTKPLKFVNNICYYNNNFLLKTLMVSKIMCLWHILKYYKE
ncbi:hypothetical protein HpBGD13_07580 [Helicobacter pylori]